MSAGRRIQLIQTPIQVYNPYTSLALRFTVLATNNYLLDQHIFKVLARPANPLNPGQPATIYLGVCNPADLLNLPTTPPTDPTQPYRVDLIDLTFDTESDATAGWANIQANATALINALNANDTLGTGNSVWIGTPPS